MICKNCNKENINGRKYCFYCGYDFTQMEETPHDDLLEQETKIDEQNVDNQPQIHANKQETHGKNILLISIISIAIIAISIAVIVVSLPKTQIDTTRDEEDKNVTQQYVENDIETKQAETVKSIEYENINVKTDFFDEEVLNNIQRELSSKSSDLNMNVKLIIDDVSSSEVQEYADNNCQKECGSNGILFVKGTSNQSFAVSAIGTGKDYLPKNLRTMITEESKNNILSMDFDDAFSVAVNMIPNSKAEANLYTFDMIENSNQVVYADSEKSKLTLIDWSNDSPKKLFETNTVYFGMDGITDSPSEYKSATPKGEFKLGFAFSNHSLNTNLDTMTVTSGMVWVDDTDSDYYNTIQYGPTNNPPKWSSAEDTYAIFNAGTNYACILIEHNGDGYTKGASGKGSAMYLAGKNTNLTRSYGDVNISADDMKSLLSYLDESDNPYIVIS